MARSPIDIIWLKAIHGQRPLQLSSADGRARALLDGDATAFVTELIRLAEIGHKVEAQASARAALKVVH